MPHELFCFRISMSWSHLFILCAFYGTFSILIFWTPIIWTYTVFWALLRNCHTPCENVYTFTADIYSLCGVQKSAILYEQVSLPQSAYFLVATVKGATYIQKDAVH